MSACKIDTTFGDPHVVAPCIGYATIVVSTKPPLEPFCCLDFVERLVRCFFSLDLFLFPGDDELAPAWTAFRDVLVHHFCFS